MYGMSGEKFFRRVVANSVLVLVVIGLLSLTFVPRVIDAATRSGSGAIYRGDQTMGAVALTFAVYPESEYVEATLDILHTHGAKATFFVSGVFVENSEPILLRMIAEGHSVGILGFFGRDMRPLTNSERRQELMAASNLVERVTGDSPEMFFPPHGSFDREVVQSATNIGLRTILWTHDTGDLIDTVPSLIANRAISRLRAGDFVRMHPTQATNEALGLILPRLAQVNLATTTVCQLI